MPRSATSISPFLLRVGAGERAAHVAEQLGLEQRLRQRAAVERDERLLAPQRVEVDRPRDELLAGARLARHQDRAVGARDGLDHLEHLSIASLRPMMFENWCDRPSVRFSSTFSCRSWRFSIFSRTFIFSRSMSNGLLR